jgi:biotin synthase
MKELIDQLRNERHLTADGYKQLLLADDEELNEYLHLQARKVAQARFGQGIYIRGLIEITNNCSNDCFYCGIRLSNRNVKRYTLSHDVILDCCKQGYHLGFRTFVLQGGERKKGFDDWTVDMVKAIRAAFPDCAITLSLGEKAKSIYKKFLDAGANRYLLRHETHNPEHYASLHSFRMSIEHRLQCLADLKMLGFQTGTGIMVGSPGQTTEHIIEDIQYIEQFQPAMIGIGPFIPHPQTRFKDEPAGSVELTLKLLSIFRLLFPDALIPSTTALATLSDDGRERGILAGANVVMPNLTPTNERANYEIYTNKASLGAESAEGLEHLEQRLNKIGYHISYERGDYQHV